MEQLVSILIPACNAEAWIAECIESALAQTWPTKEIIVVDDGSRDSTLSIASSFAASNVEVVAQAKRGASAARNRALSLAQGEYIQWLDADDLLAPDSVARKLIAAEPGRDSRVLLSGAWGRFYHRADRARFVPSRLWEDLEPLEWLLRQAEEGLWMATNSWLVSRRLTEMAGPWDESLTLNDDGEYFGRVVSASEMIHFVPESRCYVRRGNSGLSSAGIFTPAKLESLWRSVSLNVSLLRGMQQGARVRSACITVLQRWYLYFYPDRPHIMRDMESLAGSLGGRLTVPVLRPKYRWLQAVVGWKAARKAMFLVPAIRTIPTRQWERITRVLQGPRRARDWR